MPTRAYIDAAQHYYNEREKMTNDERVIYLMCWENGELTDEQEIKLFQNLMDFNVINHLQGMYGHRMRQLVEANKVEQR